MTFKELLWRIHLRKNCPVCNSKVIETGYETLDHPQYYKCSNNNCRWGKEGKGK